MAALVDGVPAAAIPLDDRGLAYGDGLFETVAVAQGEPLWWPQHWTRLARGCAALGIACPDEMQLRNEAASLIPPQGRGVLKLVVTRGGGPRGYAVAADARPRRVVSFGPWQGPDPGQAIAGVAVRWCETTLAIQPRLAGLKHLNRLEQVLARREWQDPSIAEGLMCDSEGRVVSGIAANLFLVRAGRLATPSLLRCGVAGVAREWVLAQGGVEVCEVSRAEVEVADELFLTSSLRGILPVARLDGLSRDVGPMTQRLQRELWRREPGIRPAGLSA
jgi:4-amino-4-deoxychorismate lyase